jgi:hypothetical protein
MDAATVASKTPSAISEVVQKELGVLVLVRDGPLSGTRLSDCCARLPLHFVREAAASACCTSIRNPRPVCQGVLTKRKVSSSPKSTVDVGYWDPWTRASTFRFYLLPIKALSSRLLASVSDPVAAAGLSVDLAEMEV